MPLPHLHIFHPLEERLPGITIWLAAVQSLLQSDANWDGCEFHRTIYNSQASFEFSTAFEKINKNLGPVILIQKVRRIDYTRLHGAVSRKASVFQISCSCEEDILQVCEDAREAYERGEPLVPNRELVAYLIIRKLIKQDKWGGTSLNKSFLWSDDLPKGGFPKDYCDKRLIMDTAEALRQNGILTTKESENQRKYALASKEIIEPILDSKSFTSQPSMEKFFRKSKALVPATLLDYNE